MSLRANQRIRKATSLLLLSGLCAIATPLMPREKEVAQSKTIPMKGEFADINGIKMYYEIHGNKAGVPLVLLHGGGSTIDVTYGRIIKNFAQNRKVIALEEQAHGRTTDRDAPVRFETSADDVAALLSHLKVTRADVMGFSNGGSVALQLVIRHPGIVRKLIFAGSMTKRAGAPPQFWEMIKTADFAGMPQPLKDAFLKVNPDPKKLRNMCDKDIERMHNFTDVSDNTLKSIQTPTLVLMGDRDVPTPEHGAELIRILPNARLLILPGAHGDYFGELAGRPGRMPAITAGLVEEFLDQP